MIRIGRDVLLMPASAAFSMVAEARDSSFTPQGIHASAARRPAESRAEITNVSFVSSEEDAAPDGHAAAACGSGTCGTRKNDLPPAGHGGPSQLLALGREVNGHSHRMFCSLCLFNVTATAPGHGPGRRNQRLFA